MRDYSKHIILNYTAARRPGQENAQVDPDRNRRSHIILANAAELMPRLKKVVVAQIGSEPHDKKAYLEIDGQILDDLRV
jgi:hypothetical protein